MKKLKQKTEMLRRNGPVVKSVESVLHTHTDTQFLADRGNGAADIENLLFTIYGRQHEIRNN